MADDGTLRCAVLSRYQTPLPLTGGVLGYRAMKLGTVTAPVAVRLVDGDGNVVKLGTRVEVRASEVGFVAGAADQKDVCPFHPGTAQFRTQRPLAGVACVTVTMGREAKQFPLPIMSDAPLTLPFETNPQKAELADFERAVLKASAETADARLAQSVCFEAVADLIKRQKNADALARADGGCKSADAADKSLTDELARLKEQQERLKSDAVGPILAKMEQSLAALRVYNDQLGKHLNEIKKVVARENDPAFAAKELQAQSLNTRIQILLARGDVDEALAAYDQLAALLPEDVAVRERKDRLKAEWAVKDDAHQKARDHLLKTWPAVATIPDFDESTARVRGAVDVCKKHGDRHTLRKLVTTFDPAVKKLNELVAPLDPASDADKKLLADANRVGKVMAALDNATLTTPTGPVTMGKGRYLTMPMFVARAGGRKLEVVKRLDNVGSAAVCA